MDEVKEIKWADHTNVYRNEEMKSTSQVLAYRLASRNEAVHVRWRSRGIEKAFWLLQRSALASLN